MMLIGRPSGRENLLVVTGVEPMDMIRTHLANHIRASSPEQWLHQQARHVTASDRDRRHANSALDAGAPSTHDYSGGWTPPLVGLSPTGTTTRLAARLRMMPTVGIEIERAPL